MYELSDRQRREVEYHKHHAETAADKFRAVEFEVVTAKKRRWWNAYWDVWTSMLGLSLEGKTVLVAGCGAGADALRFAKAGATVFAFDLSPDMLAHGVRLAEQLHLSVEFAVMPCEQMSYREKTFDLVFARDILHHVDIPATMKEISRVAKPGAVFVMDEIYSHSITNIVRHSSMVKKFLYPRMQKFVYGHPKPYITSDERKLTERDVVLVNSFLKSGARKKYFNFLVTRILPDRYALVNRVDRIILIMAGPLACFLAGRIVQSGHVR